MFTGIVQGTANWCRLTRKTKSYACGAPTTCWTARNRCGVRGGNGCRLTVTEINGNHVWL